jgi:hypothetical protein
MTNSTKLPVLLLTYRKEEFLDELLTVISNYEPSVLYVFHNLEKDHLEKDLVLNVKSKIDSFDYPHRIVRYQHESHLDINTSIRTAIDTVFEIEEKLIIIEDDIIPNQSFFTFCEKMLEMYKDDSEIGVINGCNLNAFKNRDGIFISNYTLPFWGWATWRDKWKLFDTENLNWKDVQEKSIGFKADKRFLNYFFKNLDVKNTSWDVQWSMILMYYNQKTILPCTNLISNQGFNKKGTYTNYKKSAFNKLRNYDVEEFNFERVNDDLEKKYQKKSSALLQEILINRKGRLYTKLNIFFIKLRLK